MDLPLISDIKANCEQITTYSKNLFSGKLIQLKKYENLIANLNKILEKLNQTKNKANKIGYFDTQIILRTQFNQTI